MTIFDPRDASYKLPFGAVASGAAVSFSLRPPRREGFCRATLLARFEFRGDEMEEIPLLWRETDFKTDVFSGTLETGGYVGLIWYRFRLERPDGGFLTVDRDGAPWQLTVYDPAYVTPAWFGEGVTYHIFPDRFCRLATPEAARFPRRRIHPDWEDTPDYLPDEQGKITNTDFFGGSLSGVEEKLEHLQALGVETIYFCPVFEAAENHRYATADYQRIDPMLGTNEDFSRLCAAARARGMRVLLDGVFSHTGSVSRYFNADGAYPDCGACQSQTSPYYPWYRFSDWPQEYEAWWGIRTLPAVNELEPSYLSYMTGPDGIVRRWLRAGASGWRLDVADELPDAFVSAVFAAAREENPDAVLIGEVWEDGSNKISYGVRRRHLLGGHLDGLMNYPFRSALIQYLRGGDAADFYEAMETLREHYPPAAFYSAMNSLGTHDTPRILTLLGSGRDLHTADRQTRARHRLSEGERERGLALLRLAALILFCFPGSPTVYYGDEAGLEGWEDPFNRRTYPWGREDAELLDCFRRLGALRRDCLPLRRGSLQWCAAQGPTLAFSREAEHRRLTVITNRGDTPVKLTFPCRKDAARNLLSGDLLQGRHGALELTLPPLGALLLED